MRFLLPIEELNGSVLEPAVILGILTSSPYTWYPFDRKPFFPKAKRRYGMQAAMIVIEVSVALQTRRR